MSDENLEKKMSDENLEKKDRKTKRVFEIISIFLISFGIKLMGSGKNITGFILSGLGAFIYYVCENRLGDLLRYLNLNLIP